MNLKVDFILAPNVNIGGERIRKTFIYNIN